MSDKQTTDKVRVTLTFSVFLSVIISTAVVVGFLYEIRNTMNQRQEKTHEAVVALQGTVVVLHGKTWSIQDQVDWARDLERENKVIALAVPHPRKTVIERLETSVLETKSAKTTKAIP